MSRCKSLWKQAAALAAWGWLRSQCPLLVFNEWSPAGCTLRDFGLLSPEEAFKKVFGPLCQSAFALENQLHTNFFQIHQEGKSWIKTCSEPKEREMSFYHGRTSSFDQWDAQPGSCRTGIGLAFCWLSACS